MHMVLTNLNAQDSAAIVGWSSHGLAGYAVHAGDRWSCYGRDSVGEARRIFRRAGAAMRWLRQTARAQRFESLADPDELSDVLAAAVTRDDLCSAGPVACLSDPAPRTASYAVGRVRQWHA